MDKHVSAILNVKDKRVTFRPGHGVRAQMSFQATQDDKLVWDLSGGEGHTAFITFDSKRPSPLTEPQTLQSSGDTITGTVRSDAPKGEYHYLFEVEGPGLPRTRFDCFWEGPAGDAREEIDMGGGDITDPPPSP